MIGFSALFLIGLWVLLAWWTPMNTMGIFVDWPTLLVFLVLLGLTIVTTKSWQTFKAGCKAATSKQYPISEPMRNQAIALFELLAKATWGIALILVVAGCCIMLSWLSDPAAIGPNLSVVLLGLLYGVIINIAFFYPAIYILKQRNFKDETPQEAAGTEDVPDALPKRELPAN